MTESEFAAALRSCKRETVAERTARLAPVAHELEVAHQRDYFGAEDRWSHRESTHI